MIHLSKLLLPLAMAGLSNLSEAEPLSFDRALKLAEERSAAVQASTSAIASAQAATIPAASLPDPRLVAGIDNYPVSGPDAGSLQRDFMTMQKIGVMQDFPNADKRRAREAVAAASVDLASAQWRVSLQSTRLNAALAWINLYYLMKQQAQFTDWERDSNLFTNAVTARLAASRGPAADALAPKQEAVQLADRRDEVTRDVDQSRAALRALIGTDADETLIGDPPVFAVVAGQLHDHLQHHPELQAVAADTARAQAEYAEARATKRPDWGVELDYARRGPQFGNMVSLQFTVDLPLFQSTRQDPLVASKHEALKSKAAEAEGMLRDHTRDLEQQLAEYASLSRQVDRAQQVALPLAEEKVTLLTASYQAGSSDIGIVMVARRERIEERLRIADLQRQQAILAARLHFAYGDFTP